MAFILLRTGSLGASSRRPYNPIVPAFYCYILECSDGTYYTGWTTDPDRRLCQHNKGQGSRYTRARRPVQLVYLEDQPDRSSAQKRERRLKTFSRTRKLKLIDGFAADPHEKYS